MTIKLYDEQPYGTEFEAVVTGCIENEDGIWAELDRTLFFPEEGGQSPDKGVLKLQGGETIDVLDVQIHDGLILHKIDRAVPSGSAVSGRIDWKHRFNNMQQHSGEHIFSGIVNKRFGYDNVGFHLSDNEVTMDYNGVLTKEELLEIEHDVNEAIIRNVPIRCWYPSAAELKQIPYRSKKEIDGDVRIVKIGEYDTCACCAPHVRTTAEIGMLKVVGFQSHKGGVRVWILCGFRALEEFNRVEDAATVVSREYSVPVSEEAFAGAIAKKNENAVKLKARVESLQKSLMDVQLKSIAADVDSVTLFVEGIDEIQKRSVLNELVTKHAGFCSVFDGNDEDGYSFIIASANMNCNDIVKLLKEKLGARGGGKPIMVQGSVKASKEQIESCIIPE